MGLLKNPGTTTVSGFFFCLKLCFGANLVQIIKKAYFQGVQCGFVLYAFFAFFVVKHRSLIQKDVIVTHDVLPLNTNQASQCVRELTEAFAKAEGIAEQLKATNNLLWAQEMNNCKARAEEIVLREVVFR